MTAAENLYEIGPGGFCGDCGHFAARHVGLRCLWPERPCKCKGMLWQGKRIEMNGIYGPLLKENR
jgi:hypothetical protein